jgi:cytochrome c oxidase cbb3-type subunit IV
MTFENLFLDARSAFTVISFLTFVGIMFWTYGLRRSSDFEAAANLPFADDMDEMRTQGTETQHG